MIVLRCVDPLLEYVQDAGHSLPLHLAQAVLHTPTGESGYEMYYVQQFIVLTVSLCE